MYTVYMCKNVIINLLKKHSILTKHMIYIIPGTLTKVHTNYIRHSYTSNVYDQNTINLYKFMH